MSQLSIHKIITKLCNEDHIHEIELFRLKED